VQIEVFSSLEFALGQCLAGGFSKLSEIPFRPRKARSKPGLCQAS